MQEKLLIIKNLLTGIEGLRVYHYWRPRLQAPYCIWQEETEGESLHTDNKKTEQVISGSIDYFTKTDLDLMVDEIQNALNNAEMVAWSLESVDYEDETDLIHYVWSFEVA